MQFSSLLSSESLSSLGSFSGLTFLVIFFLFFMIVLAFILIVPIHLSLDIRKKGPLLQGGYKLTWVGITLGKNEILPQSARDLLASISKEGAGKKVQATEDRKSKAQEVVREKKESQGEEEGREREGKGEGVEEEGRNEKEAGEEAKMEDKSGIDSPADKPRNGVIGPPRIQSLVNVAPALANILLDLLKSILFKKLSCRLCFGWEDPAQTAVISGYLWSLASVLDPFQAKISIEPWFEGERLEGEFMAEIEARLLWSVFAVIQALRKREIRLLIKEMLGLA
jgi:hypothetical protein